MDLKSYQNEAKRTCPSLGSDKLDLAHMVLGIYSEHEELMKAIVEKDAINQMEEMSDQMWYIANYCTFRGFDLQELYNDRFDFTQEDWEENCAIGEIKLSKLQDYIKKYIAYNKPLNEFKEKDAIKGILCELQNDCDFNDIDLFEGLDRNIAKLKARFPDKFTEEAALNRNLEKERQILEGNA